MKGETALVEIGRSVETRADFCAFVAALLQNYKDRPGDWENASLEAFLEGVAAFSRDFPGYVSNSGANIDPEQPSWSGFAEILIAARVYE